MNGIKPASIPTFTSLAELLHWRAQQQGDQLANIFLADGATQEERITYRALNERARTIGAFLQKELQQENVYCCSTHLAWISFAPSSAAFTLVLLQSLHIPPSVFVQTEVCPAYKRLRMMLSL